ncbi:hypothetical protein BJX61DRAFT_513447 [Aspergillus egyptiacus]|nr:hypothetical protein BJX61DRAFT_513447 [Aspergillus egyptiacus]
MALRLLPSNTFPRTLPQFVLPSRSLSFAVNIPYHRSTIFAAALRPAAFTFSIPGIISDIWESILLAVPKKKTSHMKKRHRQMAGKALKDVKHFTNCPACGQPKRPHVLCQHCVSDIKKRWGKSQLA